MIELVLVFLLGMLCAGLIWLLVLPAVWRRAERLTRERIERALPLNTNEILAERDRERAAFAVQRLTLDAQAETTQAGIVQAKAEVGRLVAREAELLGRIALLERTLEQRTGEISMLEAQSAERGATIARLTGESEAALADIQRLEGAEADLKTRLAQAQLLAETERRQRDEAEVLLASARAAEGEARARALALREEMLTRQHDMREGERTLSS